MMIRIALILASVAIGLSLLGDRRSANELCPIAPGAEDAEMRCKAAILAAERSGERRLLGKLLENLAWIYGDQGRHQEEIAVLRRSIDQLVEPQDLHNPATRLAVLLTDKGEMGEAEEVLRSLLSAYGQPDSEPSVWMRGQVEMQLADLLEGTGRKQHAGDLYERSIEDLSVGPGEGPACPALMRLIQLYLSQSRVEQASEACRRWKSQLRVPPSQQMKMCDELTAAMRSVREKGELQP